MNITLKGIHRWVGFPIGLFFLMTFGTGCLTAFNELVERFDYANYQYHPLSLIQQAEALEVLLAKDTEVRQLILPTERTPYYQLELQDQRQTYAIDNLNNPLIETNENSPFFSFMLNLHRHFLLNKHGIFGISGFKYVAWIGLAGLLLSCVGLWIWWPVKGRFNAKNIVPNGVKRQHLFQSHLTAGVVTLIAIILLAVTGVMITYSALTKRIFSIDNHANVIALEQTIDPGWAARLAAVDQLAPDSQLTRIYWSKSRHNDHSVKPAKEQDLRIVFQLKSPHDWLGMAQSEITLDPHSSKIVEVQMFGQLGMLEKLYSLIIPLHTGRGLSTAYVAVLFGFTLLGSLMVLSGILSFLKNKRQWKMLMQLVASKFFRAPAKSNVGGS